MAPLNLPEDMADDPQVQAMGMMLELEHPVTGKQSVAGPIVSMSATPTSIDRASPGLGDDTDEVLRLAGLAPTEIAQAREAGVIL